MTINTGSNPQVNPNAGSNLNLGTPTTSSTIATGGGISLSKGSRESLSAISLAKGNKNPLNHLYVGLGWDENGFEGKEFDLDVAIFMLGENEKVPDSKHFIFYNQLQSPNGAVKHSGDNRDGKGAGDDESVEILLGSIPTNISKLVFTITINECLSRNQNFGQVKNGFIRVVDKVSNTELLRFDLSEKYSSETALVVAEIYRYNGEWKFNAIGSGYKDDLGTFCSRYGVSL